jgi:hypothetical protein
VGSSKPKPHLKKPVLGTKVPPSTKKPIVEVDRRNYMASNPAWRFNELDLDGPYGWDRITRIEFDVALSSLKSFESQTWNAIFVAAKYQHHSVAVKDLVPEARKRLIQLKKDDLDELHRLRLSNKCRVWGIFRGGTFSLLWWDPDHEVCPSKGADN